MRTRERSAAALRWAMVLLMASWAAPPPAAAAELYVDNVRGNDAHSGRAPQPGDGRGPLRTVSRALAIARPGDRIVLARTEQPYREVLSLCTGRHCGSALAPFEIDGSGAILDGTAPLAPGLWEPVGGPVFRCRPKLLSYQRLFLNGQPAEHASQARPATLAARQYTKSDLWFYFCVEPEKLPQDYALSVSAQRVGITLYHVHDVIIRNLVIQGFQLDGINAHDSARRIVLENVVCRWNGRSGLAVGGASLVEASGCTFEHNGTAQVLSLGLSHTYLEQCGLASATAQAIVRTKGRVYVDGQEWQE
jgi:hypothetical protein